MKKIVAIMLVAGLVGSAVLMTGCTKKEKTLAGIGIGAAAGAGIGAAAGRMDQAVWRSLRRRIRDEDRALGRRKTRSL